jgi:YbbR domain-containing protein
VEERRLNVPLEILNLPKTMALTTKIPKYIKVTVKGPKRILSTLTSNSIKSELDLLTAQVGEEQSFKISIRKLEIPERLEVVNFIPQRINIKFEEIDSHRVRLTPKISGKPKSGFIAGRAIVQPDYIDITGPKSSLEKIREIALPKVEIEGRSSEVYQRVRIILKNSLKSKIKTALVRVPIFETKGIRVFTVPIRVEGVMDLDKRLNYRISHKQIDIKVQLPSKVKDLKSSNFKAWIDISGTGIDSQGNIVPNEVDSQEISVKYPKGIKGLEFLGSSPEKVTIYYSKKKLESLPGPKLNELKTEKDKRKKTPPISSESGAKG